jgi:hypothetical protein
VSSPNAKRTAARKRATSKFRMDLCAEVGRCEGDCGKRKPVSQLACHEIASGTGTRQKSLDKRFAILVLCNDCHPAIQTESKERQLARLWLNRSGDLDLLKFNELRARAPDAITFDEVLAEADRLLNPTR